jgi:hypothetical protein
MTWPARVQQPKPPRSVPPTVPSETAHAYFQFLPTIEASKRSSIIKTAPHQRLKGATFQSHTWTAVKKPTIPYDFQRNSRTSLCWPSYEPVLLCPLYHLCVLFPQWMVLLDRSDMDGVFSSCDGFKLSCS